MIRLVAPVVTCALLVGVAAGNAARHRVPPGVDAYHESIREAVEQIPYNIGNWVGTDTEIRQEALRILDANSTVSRVFKHLITGDTATLLLVQCADARSLLGHYPPVCYPSQGWSQLSAAPQTFQSTDGEQVATEYVFGYDLLQQSSSLEVLHFTVLPDGRIGQDMALLDSMARDRRFTFYGGASVQFIVTAGLPEEERLKTYKMLYQAAAPWLAAVQAGIPS